MLPSLTPAVTRALEAACRYSAGSPEGIVQPVHLLHGLLEEEDGRAATLAEQAGLDRQAYLALRGMPGSAKEGEPVLGHNTTEILDAARELAFELTGDSPVSSEAVLLALVRTDTGLAGWLATLGFDRACLEAVLQENRPPAATLDAPLELADLTERMDIARILDVGFNRAREALRIIEDYSRFSLDDAFLSEQLKQLRHDLTVAVEELAPEEMLHARETIRDVGTQLSTDSERQRGSLLDVAFVNFKRLQESLRSLEEFSKINWPLLAERVEQMRYRAYTLERSVVLGSEARRLMQDARLYVLLSGASCAASLEWTIAEAAAGGANVIQLREKHLSDRDLLDRARNVRSATRRAGVLFIVNDRPDIARLVEADGVHLGQDDMPVKEARRILGPGALIGVSTHTLAQVRQAVLDGASYIGVGPVFPSRTKSFEALAGLDFVRSALAETSLPAFAIGGINLETVTAVAKAGAKRVAVSQVIAEADDPRRVAMELRAALAEQDK